MNKLAFVVAHGNNQFSIELLRRVDVLDGEHLADDASVVDGVARVVDGWERNLCYAARAQPHKRFRGGRTAGRLMAVAIDSCAGPDTADWHTVKQKLTY